MITLRDKIYFARAPSPLNSAYLRGATHTRSKYSIEKVRARMFADGSVLPVGSPKRGKDGLYLRPAGRQRKGMDWDGVNGRWVPEGSLMH